MKKNLLALTLLSLVAAASIGCGSKEEEPATVPAGTGTQAPPAAAGQSSTAPSQDSTP